MSASTPVEKVGEILEAAKYRRLSSPLVIAGLAFDLPAAFVGSEKSSDLVLAADTALEPASVIARKVEGIGRALDVMQSKRPITLVLVGPRPDGELIERLSKVCRVLAVGTFFYGDSATALRNWLSVLLPLKIPAPDQGIADPLESIRSRADDIDEQIRSLIELAPDGADAVQAGLHSLLTKTLEQAP